MNLYRSVFSLRLRSREFGISSRDLSLNNFNSGLWSTATIKFAHPSTKYLALSKAWTTASASPSTGAYRDSAGFVNRLPTSAIFQPDGQQNGFMIVQVQYFWKSQNPIPDLDQSVARHVTLDLS